MLINDRSQLTLFLLGYGILSSKCLTKALNESLKYMADLIEEKHIHIIVSILVQKSKSTNIWN